jgi:hypothetical protein
MKSGVCSHGSSAERSASELDIEDTPDTELKFAVEEFLVPRENRSCLEAKTTGRARLRGCSQHATH